MPKALVHIIMPLPVLHYCSKKISFSSLENDEWNMKNRAGGIVSLNLFLMNASFDGNPACTILFFHSFRNIHIFNNISFANIKLQIGTLELRRFSSSSKASLKFKWYSKSVKKSFVIVEDTISIG